MVRCCQKPVFRGWWYPLIYLCDLCKKLEDPILKNMDRILKKNIFQGVVSPDLPPSGGLILCVILISSSCTKMRTFAKTRGLYPQKHRRNSQKNIFEGVVPPDLPPSGPFRGSDPMCEFKIFKLHQSEDLCKKLEDSILKNIDGILKKTFFRGWYPLIYLLQGPSGCLTLCVSLLSSSCTKMRTFVKN